MCHILIYRKFAAYSAMLNKEKISSFVSSRDFKRILFLFGIIFLILTAFIFTNPEPFLKFGYLGIFVFALFGPASLLVPVLAQHMNVPLLALVTALGMALNDSVSWLIGNTGHSIIPHSKRVERIEQIMIKHGKPALFFWALVPFPYDLIGLIAGYTGFSWKGFLVPTFLGRLCRFLLLGYGVIHLVR